MENLQAAYPNSRVPNLLILKDALMEDKTTCTIEEVADLLNCQKANICRTNKQGRLKAAKIGKKYRISKLDLVQRRNPHPAGVVMWDWLCRSRMG